MRSVRGPTSIRCGWDRRTTADAMPSVEKRLVTLDVTPGGRDTAGGEIPYATARPDETCPHPASFGAVFLLQMADVVASTSMNNRSP